MKSILEHFESIVVGENVFEFRELNLLTDIGSTELNLLCMYINNQLSKNEEIKITVGNVNFQDSIVQKIFELLIYYSSLKSKKKIFIDVTGYYDSEDELFLNFSALYFVNNIKIIEDKYYIIIDDNAKKKFIRLMQKPIDYNVSELDAVARVRIKLDNQESINKVLADKLTLLDGILRKELRMENKEDLIEDVNNLVSETYTNARDHSNSTLYIDIDIVKLPGFDLISYVAYNCSDVLIYTPIENLIFSDISGNYKKVIHEIRDEVLGDETLRTNNQIRSKYLFGKVCELSVSTREGIIDEEDSGIGIRSIAKRLDSYNSIRRREFENYFMSGEQIMTTKFKLLTESAFFFPGTLVHGNLTVKI